MSIASQIMSPPAIDPEKRQKKESRLTYSPIDQTHQLFKFPIN